MNHVHKTKTALAVEALREAITRGQIKPGERLKVAYLSDLLGMSPTPIREAVRILQAEGLIDHEPHHTVSVADLAAEDAQELYLLRGMLEELATRLAVPRLSEADLAHLKDLESQMRAAQESGDDAGMARVNAQWHLHLYHASGTKYLQEFILRLWSRFPWDTIWIIPGRREKSWAQHTEIMKAIEARDAEAAARLMREHVLSGQTSVIDHWQARENSKVE